MPLVVRVNALVPFLSAGFLVALGAGSAIADNHPAPEAYPTKITVEGLVLGRDDIDGTDFTGPDHAGSDQFVPFKPSDLDPSWSGGLRVTIEDQLGGRMYQFSGFYAGPFNASKTITGADDGSLETNATYDDDAHLNPGADVETDHSDELYALAIKHKTTLAGAEINLLKDAGIIGLPGHSLLLGIRGLYLAEDLRSTAYDEINDFLGTDDDIDRVRIRTKNRLFGAQIGLQSMQMVSQDVYIGGNIKAGLFANFVDRKRSFSDLHHEFLDDNDSGTGFAQVVEFNPQIKVKLSDNSYFAIGGNVTWVNGVSEAGDQYRTVTDADDRNLRDDGSVLFYGATASLVYKLN